MNLLLLSHILNEVCILTPRPKWLTLDYQSKFSRLPCGGGRRTLPGGHPENWPSFYLPNKKTNSVLSLSEQMLTGHGVAEFVIFEQELGSYNFLRFWVALNCFETNASRTFLGSYPWKVQFRNLRTLFELANLIWSSLAWQFSKKLTSTRPQRRRNSWDSRPLQVSVAGRLGCSNVIILSRFDWRLASWKKKKIQPINFNSGMQIV